MLSAAMGVTAGCTSCLGEDVIEALVSRPLAPAPVSCSIATVAPVANPERMHVDNGGLPSIQAGAARR